MVKLLFSYILTKVISNSFCKVKCIVIIVRIFTKILYIVIVKICNKMCVSYSVKTIHNYIITLIMLNNSNNTRCVVTMTAK